MNTPKRIRYKGQIYEAINEGKRGFVRKYRGCSIHDMGDVYVCTNEHGLNIGQSPTESGCEGLIDEYLAKNSQVQEELNGAVESSDDITDYVEIWDSKKHTPPYYITVISDDVPLYSKQFDSDYKRQKWVSRNFDRNHIVDNR